MGQRLYCQHLRDRQPAAVEGVRHAGHAEAPDAVALGPGRGDRCFACGFEAAYPMHEGLGVVRAQILDVENFEAGAGDVVERARCAAARRPEIYPNSCHVCEVEIDCDTGRLENARYDVIDAAGFRLAESSCQ